jgi:hypothetical protein
MSPDLALPERPSLPELRPFVAAALSKLGEGCGLAIDASLVSRLPLPWLQALVSASREAALTGQKVTILNPTFAFLFSFEAVGLKPEPDLFQLEFA